MPTASVSIRRINVPATAVNASTATVFFALSLKTSQMISSAAYQSPLAASSISSFASVHNYKNERELRFRALLTESGSELELARV